MNPIKGLHNYTPEDPIKNQGKPPSIKAMRTIPSPKRMVLTKKERAAIIEEAYARKPDNLAYQQWRAKKAATLAEIKAKEAPILSLNEEPPKEETLVSLENLNESSEQVVHPTTTETLRLSRSDSINSLEELELLSPPSQSPVKGGRIITTLAYLGRKAETSLLVGSLLVAGLLAPAFMIANVSLLTLTASISILLPALGTVVSLGIAPLLIGVGLVTALGEKGYKSISKRDPNAFKKKIKLPHKITHLEGTIYTLKLAIKSIFFLPSLFVAIGYRMVNPKSQTFQPLQDAYTDVIDSIQKTHVATSKYFNQSKEHALSSKNLSSRDSNALTKIDRGPSEDDDSDSFFINQEDLNSEDWTTVYESPLIRDTKTNGITSPNSHQDLWPYLESNKEH